MRTRSEENGKVSKLIDNDRNNTEDFIENPEVLKSEVDQAIKIKKLEMVLTGGNTYRVVKSEDNTKVILKLFIHYITSE